MLIVEKNRRFHTNLGEDPRALLDPNKLYLEQYAKARATATGMGKLVFEFIPFSVIKSFALAIDPMKKFRAQPVKITPVNRTRWREVQSVLDTRRYRRYRHLQQYQSFIWSTRGGPPGLFCYSPPELSPSSGTTLVQDVNLAKQPASITTTKDTTTKTRPVGSDFGEFEHFSYKIFSTPFNYSRRVSIRSTATMSCNNQVSWSDSFYYTANQGPAGIMSKADLDALRTSEISDLQNLMQDKVLGLISKTVPTSRRYTAFRNVAELKDLPRAILSLKDALRNLQRSYDLMSLSEKAGFRKYLNSGSKDIPSQYVGYHFGWKQIYRDVMDLLEKPVRAVREVNRLMRRSGQPTTFRSLSKFAGKTTGTPVFNYDNPTGELYSVTWNNEHRRKHELRCVVNATFDFPKVNVPSFQKQLFLHKIGVNPMPTDLYNLVPWTWLVDWFTGLGNYVEAIDTINSDPSLINWGMLTGITKGEIRTTRNAKIDDITSQWVDGTWNDSKITRTLSHQSTLEYTLQIRRNVTSSYDVKTILEPSSLSLYQQSILAAILASRRK
jgi:hypothetical protein